MSAKRKVQIPSIGDLLVLAAPWRFHVVNEHRNATLVAHMGKTVPGRSYYPLGVTEAASWHPLPSTLWCTIPSGAVLRVSRIYIRNGASGYDSVTFWWKPSPKVKSVRFFARLPDVNKMSVRSDAWTARDEEDPALGARRIELEE